MTNTLTKPIGSGQALFALVVMAFGAVMVLGASSEPKPEPAKSPQRVKWERGRSAVQRQCDASGMGYRQCARLLEQYDAIVPRG